MHYRWQNQQLFLNVRLQPRASKTEVCGLQGDALKVRLTSPPVNGTANAQLIKFIAELFSVPRCQVALVKGKRSRDKTVCVMNPVIIPDFIKLN